MFGTYEDNIMIYRREIPQVNETTITIGNENSEKTDVKNIEVDVGNDKEE